ncbi:MAG: hypothetical protein E6600_04495 [Anaerocolumna aminovalerica]|uniref:hypothetical protein n=1 Tax=Anaerocolumna aminovalerica TaxID=1527 RepID=UPI00291088E0|nr:hypothetical protein [Anaerocolumna aminovalerica]MDU6263741.1 hypothetical protein [Anaerocolumna aminovalerica]
MAWYHGTYECGHEGRVNIIGPTKERGWKKEIAFSRLCPECWQKHAEEERERLNRESLEKAKEMELPELVGTEKQVAWANTLRQKIIDELSELSENAKRIKELNFIYGFKLTSEEILKIRDYIIDKKVKASDYIDNRNKHVFEIIECEMKDALKKEEEIIKDKIDRMTELEIKAESTVKPENPVTETVVEIQVKDDKVTAKFEKNDEFREIVKELGFKWNGIWEREITEFTGKAEDRASELGNKLLNAGFPIMILDETVRNNAVNGIYERECTRWIKFREKESLVAINWQGKDDKLYKIARTIPDSKWSNPSVVVKVERYKEIEEFADLYDFKFSKAALKAIEEHKEALEKIKAVKPAGVKEEILKDGLQDILNSNSDILESLRDD